jgi:hypothetical protein
MTDLHDDMTPSADCIREPSPSKFILAMRDMRGYERGEAPPVCNMTLAEALRKARQDHGVTGIVDAIGDHEDVVSVGDLARVVEARIQEDAPKKTWVDPLPQRKSPADVKTADSASLSTLHERLGEDQFASHCFGVAANGNIVMSSGDVERPVRTLYYAAEHQLPARCAIEPGGEHLRLAATELSYEAAFKLAADRYHVTKFVARNPDGSYTNPASAEFITNVLKTSGGHGELGKVFSVTDRGTVVGCGLEYKPIAVKTSKDGPELEFSGPVIDRAADGARNRVPRD